MSLSPLRDLLLSVLRDVSEFLSEYFIYRLVVAFCHISLAERFQSILHAIYTLLTHCKCTMEMYSLITVSVAYLPREAFSSRYSTCFISALQLVCLIDFLNVQFCSPLQDLDHFNTTGGK